jgi:hypothetical protein
MVSRVTSENTLMADLHAAERDSWQTCCSLCVPTVLATPDAAPLPRPVHLSVSVSRTTTHVNDIDPVCLFITITYVTRKFPRGGHLQYRATAV